MFYSGILVTAAPGKFDLAVKSVQEHGLEVFQQERASGRFIAVIEGESISKEAGIFRELLELPGVQDASLVVSQEDSAEGSRA
ncbi:chaperone NapD [Mesosutterella sp. OilRF-GAM-744-9]|uniref:Chaperone NapD n=2 Tax=Mesosutterella TaxID=2494213 RepID=A0ABS9MQ84_9BURK|nr:MULTISPECIES: chaperone NapD [unclassified Mesosutterella]MCG5030420.1 chaperone NapD [Mesosutterella sp. oilRF-744-WT-GAM-9]MCI6529762.1 chaperone NapD [Mesosutterella sp.]MDL2059425.1 chaperone NapD [Mesosutterella sp. AGMB02718]